MSKTKFTALICGFISLAATVLFYLLAFDDLFTKPMGWAPLLLLLIAETVGIIKIFAAASTAVLHMEKTNRNEIEKLKHQYQAMIVDGGERQIDTIAAAVGKDYEDTKQDIQGMIDQQILRNAYINESRREVVFIVPPVSPSVNVNVHQLSSSAAYPELETEHNVHLHHDHDHDHHHNCSRDDRDCNGDQTVTEAPAAENPLPAPAAMVVVPVTRPRVVSCPCCGANNVVVGEIGECEYCLSPLM